jgi:phospholipid/cholesterol/gamma-HCH transport system substrate-binding protein
MTLEQAQTVIATTDQYITETLGPATEQVGRSVAGIETRFVNLSQDATDLFDTFGATGEAATARLTEAEETLAAANALIARVGTTLQSVDTAANSFDSLLSEDAEPLISELRVATTEATKVIASIGAAAETDLAVTLSEIRGAAETASATIARVGEDLSSASGRVDGLTQSADATLEAARVTFANANDTLSAINGALVTGDRALTAAASAFENADRVLDEDVDQMVQSLRSTLAELESTVGVVATEIPGVTEDLRAASRSAEAAFLQIAAAVDQSAPAFREFATTALPQYGRLASETTALIDNLDTLVEQIRRDPSRFFLDPRAPEFRR